MFRAPLLMILIAALVVLPIIAVAEPLDTLRVVPAKLTLKTPEASEQLLVFGNFERSGSSDVTRQVEYSTSIPGIVEVSSTGRILPLKDGKTELHVKLEDRVTTIPIEVRGVSSPRPVSFRYDVLPILSKAHCNAGGCHGKAEGQNGFKLSVFGFDPSADHNAIVMEGRGRRVFPASPDQSLLLLKSTAKVPHGGGLKIPHDSRWYKLMRRWIVEGMTLDESRIDPISDLKVEPATVSLNSLGTQQLRVTALTQSGAKRCVTVEAEYQSNNDAIAEVGTDGLIEATQVPGEAAILVRYLGHVALCRVTRPRDSAQFDRPTERNFIDRLVWDKLDRLRIAPSSIADDATILRRLYFDTIGTLPTPVEVRQYLLDQSPDKRRKLVRSLLNRPEYANYWTQRWCDILRVDKDVITPQGAVAMARWVRDQLRQNIPYDQFVRTILTVEGNTLRQSPAGFYQVQSDPEKIARSVSQLFLGVRIECAQCHHHPFEHWDQQDYYALAGFFTGVNRTKSSLGGTKIRDKAGSDLKHPRTGVAVPAAGLGANEASFASQVDRRKVFADWATSRNNRFFAETIVNRLWAHYMGRGLVEPIDDLRATNPASNEPLMDALVKSMVELGFDLKAFTELLLDSQVYQLSSKVNESNQLDDQNYSHAAWKPLPAEVLLDAISDATGVPTQFDGWPIGYRAIEIWDNKLPSQFFEVFGRPTRQTVCACERGVEPSIAQALHLMNSPETAAKIQNPNGRPATLARSNHSADRIIEELYLATLSRFPSEAELTLMRQAFRESESRRDAAEDILWALLNTKEFVFSH